MAIQKKSLINNLTTVKKAMIATSAQSRPGAQTARAGANTARAGANTARAGADFRR